MLGLTTVLLLHVDAYCLKTGHSWTLRVDTVPFLSLLNSNNHIWLRMISVTFLNVWFFTEERTSFVYVYILSGALAFTSILLVFLARAAYTMYKAKCCRCTGGLKWLLHISASMFTWMMRQKDLNELMLNSQNVLWGSLKTSAGISTAHYFWLTHLQFS